MLFSVLNNDKCHEVEFVSEFTGKLLKTVTVYTLENPSYGNNLMGIENAWYMVSLNMF